MSTPIVEGKNRVALQHGGKGYFGEVELHVEHGTPTGKVEIEFDSVNASEWQTGALFGLEYVLEHSSTKLFPDGGRIHVSRIAGHLVDTNNAVIAYVAALALIDALGIKPRKVPELDGQRGLLIFPK